MEEIFKKFNFNPNLIYVVDINMSTESEYYIYQFKNIKNIFTNVQFYRPDHINNEFHKDISSYMLHCNAKDKYINLLINVSVVYTSQKYGIKFIFVANVDPHISQSGRVFRVHDLDESYICEYLTECDKKIKDHNMAHNVGNNLFPGKKFEIYGDSKWEHINYLYID